MKFSIIIPTKNRQTTAIQAIHSCLLSSHEDIEIVVTDVSDTDCLRKDIQGLNDPRVQYFHHTNPLSMKENWEYGVSKTSGDYITIIGDDDALMPDGLALAAELIKKTKTPVLHCKPALYKWPDYPLINRRNYIRLNLPTTIYSHPNPRDNLYKMYNFEGDINTGPGIYYGLIAKHFLEELKSKRGAYFIDENADFDSGFATLLYAESYISTTYPIFIAGMCAASNSGHMRFRSMTNKSILSVVDDASCSLDDFMWSELAKINSIDVVIISAMRRFVSEINKIIPEKKIKFNKQKAFNRIASNISTGYDNTNFKVETRILNEIAEKWNIPSTAIPNQKYPLHGLQADKGVNHQAITGSENSPDSLVIDGNGLGVSNILDVIKIVESSTTNWLILLKRLGLVTSKKYLDEQPNQALIGLAIKKINEGLISEAIDILENNIIQNPVDFHSLQLLGTIYFKKEKYHLCTPLLARSLSFVFNLETFDSYFHSLLRTQQYDFARQVVENYNKNLNAENLYLADHCLGIIEMTAGNYEVAADIFHSISPAIDQSLYYYCAAYLKFIKGDATGADKLVKQALDYRSNEVGFLELEAKIEACL